MKKILFIFGTRPEAIKLAPLIHVFRASGAFHTKVCVTAQHREMLDQVISFFHIEVDFDLDLMKPNQDPLSFLADATSKIGTVLDNCTPDLVFVQGDTSTVLAGALAAFYKKIKIAHVEAGLRSFRKDSPFPEEMNRVLASRLADFHFAPTKQAYENLVNERVSGHVFNVGNTVIDALRLGLAEAGGDEAHYIGFFGEIDFSRKIVLITCHRRESFGAPFGEICEAINFLAAKNKDVQWVYPVHPNPNIRMTAESLLKGENIIMLDPLEYPYLICLLNKSYLVHTDSGGIQEEAPSLGKPVLVLRDVTERSEGVEAGTAILVGTSTDIIVEHTQKLLDNKEEYRRRSEAINPYGDGYSSQRILEILKTELQ